ncbi:MAG: signal peptidase I [Candidatus Sumerlaeia bacterium]
MTAQAATNPQAQEKPQKQISTLRKVIGIVICLLLFGFLIAFNAGKFQAFRVQEISMEPTILDGDYILVDARGPIRPDVGDVVAVKNPTEDLEWLCKRIVGVPGDKVEMHANGYLYINGNRKFKVQKGIDDAEAWGTLREWELGSFEYFVVGDNREWSYDSTEFGPVDDADLLGVVMCIYWPLKRARIIKNSEEDE